MTEASHGVENVRSVRHDTRDLFVILLLTFNAGFVDALAFRWLGRVFVTFLSGNFIFVGLGLADGDVRMLERVVVAISAGVAGIVCGSAYLSNEADTEESRPEAWRIVTLLSVQGLVLVGLSAVWTLAGDPLRHAAEQMVLLALAGFAMGLQAALVVRFNVRTAIANAVTGTLLLLGRRCAHFLDPRVPRDTAGEGSFFFVALPALYIVSAALVGFLVPSGLATLVPVLVVAIAAVVMVPGRLLTEHRR
jgi:uncharacterized membrane protein YoaK (UPF0700 family)